MSKSPANNKDCDVIPLKLEFGQLPPWEIHRFSWLLTCDDKKDIIIVGGEIPIVIDKALAMIVSILLMINDAGLIVGKGGDSSASLGK